MRELELEESGGLKRLDGVEHGGGGGRAGVVWEDQPEDGRPQVAEGERPCASKRARLSAPCCLVFTRPSQSRL